MVFYGIIIVMGVVGVGVSVGVCGVGVWCVKWLSSFVLGCVGVCKGS